MADSKHTGNAAADNAQHRPGPLPPDPRESGRGILRSVLLTVLAVVLVAAFTWGILNWRESQAQEELIRQKQQEVTEIAQEAPDSPSQPADAPAK
ncbi:MAG: hypothetical protein ACI4B6_09905 [Atopobiaceae bacterium]